MSDIDIEMIDNLCPYFSCDFFSNNSLDENCFNDNSYLKQNQLKWLLEKDDNYCNNWKNKQTIDLFGVNIDLNGFDFNQMTIVFSFVKKVLNDLRTLSSNKDKDYPNLRRNVSTFLSLIKRRLFEICIKSKQNGVQIDTKIENAFCISILKQMKGLLLFMGRLSQIRLMSPTISSDHKTWIYNYFHCCLDIWWTAIEVMYILDQNQTINLCDFALINDQICGKQLCSQTIQLVSFDLILLSVYRFNEMKTTNKYQLLSYFDCLCIKQMYILIRNMFIAINKFSVNDSPFEQIFLALNLLTNSVSDKYFPRNDFKTIAFGNFSNFSTEDTSLHFIWVVTNIVQTFNYDISGQFNNNFNEHSIPNSLLRRIALSLKQNYSDINSNFEKLSAIIIFCKNSVKYWKPNTDILLPFAEYFIKNLNKNLNKITVEELPVIPKTSVKWFQIISEISSDRKNTFIDNNLQLFLSLMSQQLANVFETSETKTKQINWQKFKGKVVVNLHSIRLESIDEIGIFNLFSFYLVLMNTNEEIFNDFIDKAIETNEQFVNINKHSELVLKFMFTLLQSKPNGLSEQKISAFISKTFDNFCNQRLNNFSSNSNKNFSNLLIVFFNEMNSLMKTNFFFDLSFDKLLNIKFVLFSNLHLTYDQKLFVISFISNLLKVINQNFESRNQKIDPKLMAIINNCFNSMVPFIKQEIILKNDNEILCETAFNLTKLVINLSENNSQKVSIVFNEFLNVSQNNRQFLCDYLSFLLKDSNLIKNLKSISDFETNLMSIWCCFLVTSDVSQSSIDSLTYLMSQLIQDLKSGRTEYNINSKEVFILFVKNLSQKLSKSEANDKKKIIENANKCFKGMIITSSEAIKRNCSFDLMKKIYCLISGLMAFGSQLLYIPSSVDCLLPKIIDSILISNHFSYDIKPEMNSVLQMSFPMIIEGLFKLHNNSSEYIERQIRKVISFYLPVYVNRPNAYLSLKKQLKDRNLYTDWTKHLYSTIVHNFFNKHESCLISPLIPFIEDFCKSDLNDQQLIGVFKGAFLKVAETTTDHKSKESLLSLICFICEMFAKNQKEMVSLENILNNFIEQNLKDKYDMVFNLVDSICRSCPKLIHNSIGQINRTIETIENSRGIGIDERLRNRSKAFAKKFYKQ